MFSATRLKVLSRVAAVIVVPTIPILLWWKLAVDDRATHLVEVQTTVRVPNVQTVDDLLVEKCQPGDVVLFDRRCDKCAAGPGAGLACILARALLCRDDPKETRSVEIGKFDHCGECIYIYYNKRIYDVYYTILCCAVLCCCLIVTKCVE